MGIHGLGKEWKYRGLVLATMHLTIAVVDQIRAGNMIEVIK
jgi:hypothetical protein